MAHMETQTDGEPLALSYPANLLYAQGMLNSTMLQLQQVERQIAELRSHAAEKRRKKKPLGRARRLDRPGRLAFRSIFSDETEALFEAARVMSDVSELVAAARALRREEEMPMDPEELLQQQMQQRVGRVLVKAICLVFFLRALLLDWFIIMAGLAVLFVGELYLAQRQAQQLQPPPPARERLERPMRQRFTLVFNGALMMFLMEANPIWYVPRWPLKATRIESQGRLRAHLEPLPASRSLYMATCAAGGAPSIVGSTGSRAGLGVPLWRTSRLAWLYHAIPLP